ncbi:hypothetical protein [Metabacillus litoralis]|nr:hypothetical protein [Metabacillus litoralis]MCM3413539.1 hypothetical protein [Metabacillus litoralis]
MNPEPNSVDRELMIFQIMMNTKFAEEALSKLSNEEITKLYNERVLGE